LLIVEERPSPAKRSSAEPRNAHCRQVVMSTWFKRVMWIIGFIIWVYCVAYYYDHSCGFTQADGSIDCVFHQQVYHYRGGLFSATVISTLFTPIIVLAIGLWAVKRAIVATGVKRVIFTIVSVWFLLSIVFQSEAFFVTAKSVVTGAGETSR
jgi:hypothetical protein